VRVIPYDQEQEALALLKERLYRATTPEQREAVELLLEQLYRDRDASIAAARKSLIAFGVRCVKGWRPEWFHAHLGGRLQRLIEGMKVKETVTREIAIAPPQHGKSALSCIIAPVWAMGKRPGLRVGVLTYAASLSTKHSRAARALASSPAVIEVFGEPTVADGKDVSQVEYWSAWGGTYFASGVDGAVTGVSLDLLVVDDILSGEAEARSPTLRQHAHSTYHSAAGTRLSSGGAVMLQGTTWHGDDPLQREMATGAYHITRYPAIAEEDEEFRKAGEALCPKLKPLAMLLDERSLKPAEVWACLYQGRPGRSGSEYVKPGWLTVYDDSPEAQAASAAAVWVTMDTGKATHSKADPTVCHVWAWWAARKDTPARMALLDRTLKVGASIQEGKAMLRRLWARWKRLIIAKAGAVLIEDTANGAAILQQGVPAEGEDEGIPSGLLWAFNPTSVPGKDKSKLARAGYFHSFAERGKVSVPTVQALPSVHDVTDCWATFPNAAHDEDMDCASMLVIHLETASPTKAQALSYLLGVTGLH